jgi:hypothetical protein
VDCKIDTASQQHFVAVLREESLATDVSPSATLIGIARRANEFHVQDAIRIRLS